ncbi:MAG: undecaprenyl-diphosphate phosphatase [Candidatus Thorarchaeota archaeon]
MIEYIFIALIQGLFEWLPISSSGQVMIVSMNFFGISPEDAFSLAIWLHLGTTIAVLLKFRREYIKIIKNIFQNKPDENESDIEKKSVIMKRNWIIFATIGTGITALPLYFIFKLIFLDAFTAIHGDLVTLFVSGLLILTGIIILKTRKIYGNLRIMNNSREKIRKDSFLSGLAQGSSILPGISRSGVTVSAILIEKYEQNDALRLSFLMSVPVVIASIIVDIFFGEGSVFGTLNLFIIIITTIVSFLIGYLTIELLLQIARKINFGYFCVSYGIIAFLIIIPFIILS